MIVCSKIKTRVFFIIKVLATYKDGKARLMAYLDDYAYLLHSLISYLQARWSSKYLNYAVALAEVICEYFYDEENAGFYFTAHDHEKLIQRPKLLADEAIPSGTGVVMLCLARLGYLLGEQKYLDIVKKTLQATWRSVNTIPSAHNSLLLALEEHLNPPLIIILRGDSQSLAKWQQVFNQHYLPQHLCFAIPNDETVLPQALQKPISDKGVIAYLCHGQECQAQIESYEEFHKYILNQS